MSWPVTTFAVLMPTAKQIPWAGRITAVLTPTTRPRASTSGPPEFPGFSAASVWITSSISRPPTERNERPSALTTPAVTVLWKPSGLPIAMTSCPTRSAAESPNSATVSETGGTRMTARSVSGSSPTSSAATGRPSANATSIRVASCTTWLFVRTNPSGVNTNPEPGRGAVYLCPYGSCRLARRRDRRNRGDRARNGTGTGAGGVASRYLRAHRSQCTRHSTRPEGGGHRLHRHAVRRVRSRPRGGVRRVRDPGTGRAAGAREQRRDRAVPAPRGALARGLGRDDGGERPLSLPRHAGAPQAHAGRGHRHHREHRLARGEERRGGWHGVLCVEARRAGLLQEPDARGAQARPPRRGHLPGLRGDAFHGQAGARAPRPRPRPLCRGCGACGSRDPHCF